MWSVQEKEKPNMNKNTPVVSMVGGPKMLSPNVYLILQKNVFTVERFFNTTFTVPAGSLSSQFPC